MGDPVVETFLLNLVLASESLDVVAVVAECRTLNKTICDALNGKDVGKDVLIDWKSRMDARFMLATSKVDLLVKRCDTSREKYTEIAANMLKGDQRLAIIDDTIKCCEELRNAMARAHADCVDIKKRTDALIESAMH